MVLNPIAVFKLQPDTDVYVDGETYTCQFVSAKEYWFEETITDDIRDMLGIADPMNAYVAHIGDSEAIIPEESIIEILDTETL